eukprot:s1634_g7.t1
MAKRARGCTWVEVHAAVQQMGYTIKCSYKCVDIDPSGPPRHNEQHKLLPHCVWLISRASLSADMRDRQLGQRKRRRSWQH